MQPTVETSNMNTTETGASAAPATPAAAPANSELQRYSVHHSYIWLGTIRTVLAVIFVLIITMFSSVIALIEEGGVSGVVAMGVAFGGMGLLLLVLIGVVVLVHFLAYKRLYFTLGPNEFSLYSGIITKKRVHVPYDRVQSVDARASLIQRIFGVRTVYIDTAGGASNKAIMVPYLTKAQTEWLTAELYARKRQALQPHAVPQSAAVAGSVPVAGGTPVAGTSVTGAPAAASVSTPVTAGVGASVAAAAVPASTQQGNVLDLGKQAWDEVGGVFAGDYGAQVAPTYEYGLTNKQLFLSGLSNNTPFVLLVFGFIGILSQFLDIASYIFPSQTDMAIDSLTSQVVNPVFSAGIAMSIVGIIVLLIVIWIIAAIGQCISFGGFRARRVGDRIEVERGLLQHARQSISVQRVQAVVVKQSFIRRLIGYCEVSLDKIDANSGEETSQKNSLNANGVVVHPFCKLADVPGILQGLVPEYAAVPQGRTPVAPVALRRALVRQCIWQGGGFWLAITTAIIQVITNLAFAPAGVISAEDAMLFGFLNAVIVGLYVIAAVVFVVEAVNAIKWARESGFAVNERFMKIVNGGLSREERSFPRNKIQYGFAKTNPFQRMSKVATINVRTAAGVGGTSVEMKDVTQQDADNWLNWLQPRPRN